MSINDEIDTIVQYHLNNHPAPTLAKITKIHEDNTHVDIETTNGTLEYVPTIASSLAVDDTVLLVFLDGKDDSYVVIGK